MRLSRNESILITAYSSIINFFGPLQSGPAFRGIYLKKKHGLKLRNYTAATFIYYFFYALFSGLFLISGLLHYWTLLIVVLVFGGLYWAQKQQNLPDRIKRLQLGGWWFVALAALLQVCIVAAIYYVELHTIAPGTSLSQVIIYTGAANFALFVSITPGAIGFRESFLVFSQNLHHISNTTIVTANIIDRAMYIVLLGVLAVFIFGSHAQRRLKVS